MSDEENSSKFNCCFPDSSGMVCQHLDRYMSTNVCKKQTKPLLKLNRFIKSVKKRKCFAKIKTMHGTV